MQARSPKGPTDIVPAGVTPRSARSGAAPPFSSAASAVEDLDRRIVQNVIDSPGRTAWVVYGVTGYSFTLVRQEVMGGCPSVEGVKGLLGELFQFSGLAR